MYVRGTFNLWCNFGFRSSDERTLFFPAFNWLFVDTHLRYTDWAILLFCCWVVPGTGGICVKLLLTQTEISCVWGGIGTYIFINTLLMHTKVLRIMLYRIVENLCFYKVWVFLLRHTDSVMFSEHLSNDWANASLHLLCLELCPKSWR